VRGIRAIFKLSEKTTNNVALAVIAVVVVGSFVGGVLVLIHYITVNGTEKSLCTITTATLEQRQYKKQLQFSLNLNVSYAIEGGEVLNSTTNTDWISGNISNDTDIFVGEQTECYYFIVDVYDVTLDDKGSNSRIIYTVTLVYSCLMFLCAISYFIEVIFRRTRSDDRQPLLNTPSIIISNGVTLPFSNS